MEASTRRTNGQASIEEARVDVRRYINAITRSRGLIALIVAIITGGVLALSLVLPKTYEGTATILLDARGSGLEPPTAETITRDLKTIEQLLASQPVLEQAADEVSGETADSIESSIEVAADTEANLISVRASDGDAERAAAIANAVANAYLDVQGEQEQDSLDAAIAGLTQQLRQVESDPTATADAGALRQRINDLEVQKSLVGSDLSLAEEAEVPDSPASPQPFRNTILAFFASLFIAVLVALARDQLRPRVSEPRELSRVMGAPVMAGIPYARGRLSRNRHVISAVEHEAYQTLRASLQPVVPPGQGKVILVTSSVHGEGKTTVTARLGRALAQAGHRTLIVSADFRWPALHAAFDLPLKPGFSDVLGLIERAGVSDHILTASLHSIQLPGLNSGRRGSLDVLTSGTNISDPARLLTSDAVPEFFSYLQRFDYQYVLVDSPPLLGIADAQPLVRQVDHVLLVSRLDRLTLENVGDTYELLERLGVQPVGLVVIGARVESSPYYLTDRPPLVEERPPPSSRSGDPV